MLKKNLFHFQTWNDDGTAHYGHDNEKGGADKFMRQFKMTGQDWLGEAVEKEINHFHFRKATHGMVNLDNVHFWESDEWIFAHNGITETGATRLSGSSDSKMLFEMLLKNGAIKGQNIDIKRIADIIGEISFWGRLIIINRKTKSAYYFGDYHLYMLGKDILVVSSTELRLDNGRSIYGIPFNYESTDILHNKFSGILKINPIRKEHKEYDIEFTPSWHYQGMGGWNDLSELSEDDDIPPALRKKNKGKKGKKKDIRMELEAMKDIEMTAKRIGGYSYVPEGQDYDREGLEQPELPI